MATTKFEIEMEIEVVDVGDVPAGVLALTDTITRRIEEISSGDVVKVTSIHASQKPYNSCNSCPAEYPCNPCNSCMDCET